MRHDVVSVGPPQAVAGQASELDICIGELESVCRYARQIELEHTGDLRQIDPRYRDSARNLLHYLALRSFDIRDLQKRLAALGLSSLGRSEPHVMASLQTVLRALHRLAGKGGKPFETAAISFSASKLSLETHAADLLGASPVTRSTRIMVTLPPEAATSVRVADRLLADGMNLARINCGHDDARTWMAMIRNVRQASAACGRECRIVMDLAGPRLRTGTVEPGPKVIRLQPRRDSRGRVISPRRVRLVAKGASAKVKGIPVSGSLLREAGPGDSIRLVDARGKKRRFRVTDKNKHSMRVECYKPTYLETGMKLRLKRQAAGGGKIAGRVGELPPVEQPILLRKGDTLVLHRGSAPGQPAVINSDGAVKEPAHVSCTLPEVFRHVQAGAPVFLNDGKIGGVVQSVSADSMVIGITRAKPSGSKLRSSKGINFPGSDLHLAGLTEKDKADLAFVACHADAVALSFVNKPEDVRALQEELKKNASDELCIILKIETRQAFDNLPRLLLAAMRRYPAGVMVARGDLAVETGWERLAEIQEEILWLCEAARLPVIWATQVLESETRKGHPSRAEISDAAMSQRAECVMLNKGPYINAAIRMLDNILRRMQRHQDKKTATLRRLSVAESLDG